MSLQTRAVRYEELKPCINAFIDSRSPGSDKKENFTIIGPGVAENPNQHVHIKIAHGFNIGGARQPANCLRQDLPGWRTLQTMITCIITASTKFTRLANA